MALIRRRKPQGSQDQPAPEAEPPARPQPESEPGSWRPPSAELERPAEDAPAPGDWVPGGVEPRTHPRRSATHARPAAAAPAAPDAAQAAAAPSPPTAPAAPESGPEDLRARLVSVEQQIAAAERAEAETRRAGHTPTASEAAASAASYEQLQRSVLDLRTRLDRQSGTQAETIQTLESRLAAFEEQLKHPPGYRRPASRAATALRILVLIGVFVVIAGAPLFTTRRTTCNAHQKKQVSWTFVKPFDDNGPPRCKNELGGTVVLDAIGLR